jgi:hypothetical protein
LVQRASMRVRNHTGRPGGSKRIATAAPCVVRPCPVAITGGDGAAVPWKACGRTMTASRTSASSAKIARNAHNARLSLAPAGTP